MRKLVNKETYSCFNFFTYPCFQSSSSQRISACSSHLHSLSLLDLLFFTTYPCLLFSSSQRIPACSSHLHNVSLLALLIFTAYPCFLSSSSQLIPAFCPQSSQSIPCLIPSSISTNILAFNLNLPSIFATFSCFNSLLGFRNLFLTYFPPKF